MDHLCAVDANLKFRYIRFGFGSQHDSRIFRNLQLLTYGESFTERNFHTVADAVFKSFSGVKTALLSLENTDMKNNQLESKGLGLKNHLLFLRENLKI